MSPFSGMTRLVEGDHAVLQIFLLPRSAVLVMQDWATSVQPEFMAHSARAGGPIFGSSGSRRWRFTRRVGHWVRPCRWCSGHLALLDCSGNGTYQVVAVR